MSVNDEEVVGWEDREGMLCVGDRGRHEAVVGVRGVRYLRYVVSDIHECYGQVIIVCCGDDGERGTRLGERGGEEEREGVKRPSGCNFPERVLM